MRPSAGLESTNPRSRKSSLSDPPFASSTTPTTFFLARESDLNRPGRPPPEPAESIPSPVATLRDTIEEGNRHGKFTASRGAQHDVGAHGNNHSGRRRSTIKQHGLEGLRDEADRRQSHLSHRGVLTPSLASSQDPSLPSSPKSTSSQSCQKSDDELTQDDTGSQAVASSDDDDGDGLNLHSAARSDTLAPSLQDGAPQLIMPSIKMPSRRPFTARGKVLGKFKVLVAGGRDSGKTSLIKSIVQLCEDIVHVDPMTTNVLHAGGVRSTRSTHCSETYASTTTYPKWWSEADEGRVPRRRKSHGDSVLERNLCFVDTSGVGSVDHVRRYIEQQLNNSANAARRSSGELINLLSGKGGSQVDLILYLTKKDTIQEDCDAMRRLAQVTNVVPLISKADLLSQDQIRELKASVDVSCCSLARLPFSPPSLTESEFQATAPYSVSSANGPDFDNMDASLLMSPEYIQPLVPSELALLVEQIFHPETVAYLRYSAAKRLVEWGSTSTVTETPSHRTASPSPTSPRSSTFNSPLQTSLTTSGVLVPLSSEISLNTSNSYALAKIADHTQREERLAEVRLSKWASDLQLSLQRERERYENIARGERALWLVQRMGEEVRDGRILDADASPHAGVQTGKNKASLAVQGENGISYQVHDPLGLLRWQDTMQARGWVALQIVGSFGVVGGIALWVAKTWGIGTSLQEWAQQWRAWQD